ncbi:E3 ubiquitin-protein ligase ZNF598 isoform X1 [Carcharodon carcharias]|uniref:E3 ubiquitin-protein ligase ZNF598 isoform X1 n=1 Tax=Carcharodon carcharias TaxID=13397 RepID=UPI001B7DB3E2|nr:E3 ubiquitin-protein ligase ZNF598 isoform X1 [Carcharodon carcharias]
MASSSNTTVTVKEGGSGRAGPGADKSCVLCCQELEIFAVGKCDHPVCYRCSTKMRALCGQRYCAVCRLELDQVVFIKKVAPFSTIATHQFHHEKKFDIYIADGRIHAQFRKLLQHDCPVCAESRPFNTFEDLEHHMRKQHEMFSCKLCVRHLQIFTYERKWYSRKDLARHRIHGDPDDTSHRGHPLCKFCDDRYLDNDELLKHLRRDHYFCHFCDSDGAQEYYSDYDYLRDHFREKHYLCEEGRCNAEQFTHAFRSEIDYKAHKAAFHSKSRAEARQNRQIDLQFNYAPRHQRRNEGMVSGDDYEEVDRFNRRGGQSRGGQNRRGRWKYNREEEDRDVAAAVRASIAARRQEEKKQAASKKETDDGKSSQSEKEVDDTSNTKNMVRTSSETVGTKEAVKGSSKQENFQVLGATAPPNPSSNHLVPVRLNEEEFPSLSASAHATTTGLTPTYTSATKKKTTFQEEDFPALVSKIKQQKPSMSTSGSAWTSVPGKSVLKTIHSSSSNSNQAVKKSLPTHSTKAKAKNKAALKSDEEEEDDDGGLTAQEFRSAPTMLDISSLLTTSAQTVSKVGKKKKIGGEKQNSSSAPDSDTVINKAQKENVPEIKQSIPVTSVLNGHTDKLCTESASVCTLKEPPGFKKPEDSPSPLPEEDFPALGNPVLPKKPPPGFNNLLQVKSPPSNLPPPPGLTAPVSKPPPGFTGVPLNSNISEPMIPAPKQSLPSNIYLLPENFKQRNVELIQSINTLLHNDETKFNKFKTQSGQFRQGRISAADYYRSCRELLGENFLKIFNELLVLLPDTAKQQELLSAHKDLREKQGSNKSKKNKKNAWQTTVNSEFDCQVCPMCQQVLTQKDFVTHKTSHFEDDEFPTLQSVSRIIS